MTGVTPNLPHLGNFCKYCFMGTLLAQHLAFELTELFASGELTPQDMDGIMYEMHKAYFKYREQKREKERIMNL